VDNNWILTVEEFPVNNPDPLQN